MAFSAMARPTNTDIVTLIKTHPNIHLTYEARSTLYDDSVDPNKKRMFLDAINENDIPYLEKQISINPAIVSFGHQLPLLQAIATGHVNIVKCLVENGADLDYILRDPRKNWLVRVAYNLHENDMVPMLRFLVEECGARVDFVQKEVLELIIDSYQCRIVDYLAMHGFKLSGKVVKSRQEKMVAQHIIDRYSDAIVDDFDPEPDNEKCSIM